MMAQYELFAMARRGDTKGCGEANVTVSAHRCHQVERCWKGRPSHCAQCRIENSNGWNANWWRSSLVIRDEAFFICVPIAGLRPTRGVISCVVCGRSWHSRGVSPRANQIRSAGNTCAKRTVVRAFTFPTGITVTFRHAGKWSESALANQTVGISTRLDREDVGTARFVLIDGRKPAVGTAVRGITVVRGIND